MNKELRVVAVVPSLNPDEKLKSVVDLIRKYY